MKYDLEQRTLNFAKEVIIFSTKISRTPVSIPLISQLVRSGTSVGANYQEANGASSRKDFRNKISICKKEAKETSYWLMLINHTDSRMATESKKLFDEVTQLSKIFTKILQTVDRKDSQ